MKRVLFLVCCLLLCGCNGERVQEKQIDHRTESPMMNEDKGLYQFYDVCYEVIFGSSFRGDQETVIQGYDHDFNHVYTRNLNAKGSYFVMEDDDLLYMPTMNGLDVEHIDGGKSKLMFEQIDGMIVDLVKEDGLYAITVDPSSIVYEDGTVVYCTNYQIKDVLIEDDVMYVVEWIDDEQCIVSHIDLISHDVTHHVYDELYTKIFEVDDVIYVCSKDGYRNLETNELFESKWNGYGYSMVYEDECMFVVKEDKAYLDVFKNGLEHMELEVPNGVINIEPTRLIRDDKVGLIFEYEDCKKVGYFDFEKRMFKVFEIALNESKQRCIGVVEIDD